MIRRGCLQQWGHKEGQRHTKQPKQYMWADLNDILAAHIGLLSTDEKRCSTKTLVDFLSKYTNAAVNIETSDINILRNQMF